MDAMKPQEFVLALSRLETLLKLLARCLNKLHSMFYKDTVTLPNSRETITSFLLNS